jgi:two-component system, OmpR family, response regulator ResD
VAASIIVADDEPAVRDLVGRHLTRAGHEVRRAADARAALALAAERAPDLVLLDATLPSVDGPDVMRLLRGPGSRPTPIVLLTTAGEDDDRVAGPRLGADDFLVKPLRPVELVARVAAVLRRPLELDGLSIDLAGRRVVVGVREAALTPREFELLAFLAHHRGQAFTRAELMERVWRYSFSADTSTVTVHVRRLRAKVEPDPAAPRFVQTVRGVGYRFPA